MDENDKPQEEKSPPDDQSAEDGRESEPQPNEGQVEAEEESKVPQEDATQGESPEQPTAAEDISPQPEETPAATTLAPEIPSEVTMPAGTITTEKEAGIPGSRGMKAVPPKPLTVPGQHHKKQVRGRKRPQAREVLRDAKADNSSVTAGPDRSRDKPRKMIMKVCLERIRRLAIPKERNIRAVLMDMWPVMDHSRVEILKKVLIGEYGLSRREVDQLTAPPKPPPGLEKFAIQAREKLHCYRYLECLTRHIAYSLFTFGRKRNKIKRTDDVVWLGNALTKYMWEGSEQTKCMVEADEVTRKEHDRKVRLIRRDFAEKIASWILGVASEADEFAEEEEKKRAQLRKEKQAKQQLIRERRKEAKSKEVERESVDKAPEEAREMHEIEGEHLTKKEEDMDEAEILHEQEVTDERESWHEEEETTEKPEMLIEEEETTEKPEILIEEEEISEEPESLNDEAATEELEISHQKEIATAIQENMQLYEKEEVFQIFLPETHDPSSEAPREVEPLANNVEVSSDSAAKPKEESLLEVPLEIAEGLMQVNIEQKSTHSIVENPCPIETNLREPEIIEPSPIEYVHKELPDELQETESALPLTVREEEDAVSAEEILDEHEEKEHDEIHMLYPPPEKIKEVELEVDATLKEALADQKVKFMSEKVDSIRTYLVKDQGDRYYIEEVAVHRKVDEQLSVLNDVVRILGNMIPTTKVASELVESGRHKEGTSSRWTEWSNKQEEDGNEKMSMMGKHEEYSKINLKNGRNQDEEHRKMVKTMITSALADAMLMANKHTSSSTVTAVGSVTERIGDVSYDFLNELWGTESGQVADDWVHWLLGVLEAAAAWRRRRRWRGTRGRGGDDDDDEDGARRQWSERVAQQAREFLLARRQPEQPPDAGAALVVT